MTELNEAAVRAEKFHRAVKDQQYSDYRTRAYEVACGLIVSLAGMIDHDYRALRAESAAQGEALAAAQQALERAEAIATEPIDSLRALQPQLRERGEAMLIEIRSALASLSDISGEQA